MISNPYKSSPLRLLWGLVRPWKGYAFCNLAANSISALFEGSTFAILAIALQVFSAPAAGLASQFGAPGAWLDSWSRAYGRDHLFLGLILCAVFAQFLRSGFQVLGEMSSVYLQGHVQAEAFKRIYARIFRMPFQRFSSYPIGELTFCIGQAEHLHDAVRRLNEMARTILMVVSYSIVLLWISWPMALAAAAGYVLISFLFRRILRRILHHARGMTDTRIDLSKRATEFLQAARVLHSFGKREESIGKVHRLADEGMLHWRRAIQWSNAIEPISDTLTVLGAGAFLLGGYAVLAGSGKDVLPGLLAFLLALYRVTPRLRAFQTNLAMLISYLPGLTRVQGIFSEEQEIDGPGLKAYPGDHRQIEFRDVTLRYLPDESPAVANLSFSIARGEFVALVGSSGAGKSSVADLLLRLFDPTSGRILVDGIDFRDYARDSWREHIAVVAQDPFLFHDTIEGNIRFGRPQATHAEVLQAARAAHAHDFIQHLSEGYRTVVGDRGYRLSGGQCQRVALARALVRRPEILILDEATSSLDSESERFIQQALNEQRGSKTIVAIAHRLSTIAAADRILVLAEGRLVEQGTHEQLLTRAGMYARMWKLQSENRSEVSEITQGGKIP